MIVHDKIKGKQPKKQGSNSNESLDEDLSLGDDTLAPPEDLDTLDEGSLQSDEGSLEPIDDKKESSKTAKKKQEPIKNVTNYLKDLELIKKNLTEENIQESNKKVN